MIQALIWVAGGTAFTAFMTALGAAGVFLFRSSLSPSLHRALLGFAAGVMLAASTWSLLIPAIEQAQEQGLPGWLPAAGGSLLGILFLLTMEAVLPHPEDAFQQAGAPRRNTLLILAVTLHNIPEGMAIGASFTCAVQDGSPSLLAAAAALALGIGIQNFPEGAAISLPLRQEGMSRSRAFFFGAASGAVEPVFGLLTVLVLPLVASLLPWLLSFAAGAMLYVVVEELIPQANLSSEHHTGTLGFTAGFLIMMILDVALG